jgi:hypothetical protein
MPWSCPVAEANPVEENVTDAVLSVRNRTDHASLDPDGATSRRSTTPFARRPWDNT